MYDKIDSLIFSSRTKWRRWLAKNHLAREEVCLVYDWGRFEARSFSYREFLCDAVEEAICYGWIDSRVKRIGQTRLGVRFTPRVSRGNWSKYNRMRALMLFHNGLMTKSGIGVLPADWKEKRGQARDKEPADCAAGVLLEKGKFLVEKRRDDDEADPGFIEIPGGHLEKGEDRGNGLRREMREELGIIVEKANFVQSGLYTATNNERDRIHYFHVEKWKGRIDSKEAARVYWESDVSNLSIISDRRAVRRILRSQI